MRVFLRKPKWIAYLLLLLILSQIGLQYYRYSFGARGWVTYTNEEHKFALDYPANWTIEEYQGQYRGYDGVVAVISNFSGIGPTTQFLMVYSRTSAHPSLQNTARWGDTIIQEQNGTSVTALEEVAVGADKLQALRQTFQYAEIYSGYNIYAISDHAEYVFFFGNRGRAQRDNSVFEQIIASLYFQE
jgi:hypothetical protein